MDKEGGFLMRLREDDIKTLIKPLIDFLKPYVIEGTPDSDPKLVDLMNQYKKNPYLSSLKKKEIGSLFVSFVKSYQNMLAVCRKDENLEKTWKKCLLSADISSTEISELMKRKMVTLDSYNWNYSTYREPFFFDLIPIEIRGDYYYSRYRETKKWFTMYSDERREYVKLFFGEQYLEPLVKKELPENLNLLVENFEPYIPSDLIYLSGIGISQSFNTIGTLTAAKIKSLKKLFSSQDFKIVRKDRPLDRIELLANAFFNFYELKINQKEGDKTKQPTEFVNFIVNKYPNLLNGTKLGPFLPEYKGITRSWASEVNTSVICSNIKNLLKGAEKGWLSLDNLKIRFLCIPVSIKVRSSYVHLFSTNARNRHTLRRKDELENEGSNEIQWFDDIDFPFVLHWIKFLCGVGILEIASDPENTDDETEGMRFVRLTPLGKFAFGYENIYQTETVVMHSELDIDDDNCIITVLSDLCPFKLFLQQISTPIGKNRFRITPESLVKGCDMSSKVMERINNLKEIVDLRNSPGLSGVIKKAEKRVKCINYLSGDYVIIKLREDLPEFAKFIIDNREVRENSILAEKGIILVKRNFIIKFQNICAEAGFLIN